MGRANWSCYCDRRKVGFHLQYGLTLQRLRQRGVLREPLRGEKIWRRGPDSNRRIKVLQTSPLTTWVPRLVGDLWGQLHTAASLCRIEKIWSGRRDLNPRLRPWQGRALPLSYSRLLLHAPLYNIQYRRTPGNGLAVSKKLERNPRWIPGDGLPNASATAARVTFRKPPPAPFFLAAPRTIFLQC